MRVKLHGRTLQGYRIGYVCVFDVEIRLSPAPNAAHRLIQRIDPGAIRGCCNPVVIAKDSKTLLYRLQALGGKLSP